MRPFAAILSLLLAPFLVASAQTPASSRTVDPVDHQYNFYGGARLRFYTDSMTDKFECFASTPNERGAWIMTSPEGAAVVATTDRIFVDYNEPAFMRIGEGAPFRLGQSRKPHDLVVPFSRVREVMTALYTQQRIRVRFTEYPDGGVFDDELVVGDFASAYDRGVELCGFKKLPVGAVHPVEPTAKAADADEFDSYLLAASDDIKSRWLGLLGADVRAVGARLNLDSSFRFTVTPDGKVASVEIIAGTGDKDADADCIQAIRALPVLASLPKIQGTYSFVVLAKFEGTAVALAHADAGAAQPQRLSVLSANVDLSLQ